MDSLTQAALGAAVGEAILGKKIGGKGAILGAIIGTIPDMDIILLPFLDEVSKISFHRGYSHSILFCVLGSLLIAYLLSKAKWTQEVSLRRLFMLSFIGLFTHVLLDSFTTYGTQLFLPFLDWRVSFDSISIIDPGYTLPLIIGLGLSIFIFNKDVVKRSLPNNYGLIISSLYLMFTLANKQHIQRVFYDNLENQEIPYYRMLTVPVAVGNAIWYGVVKDKTQLHIGKYSMFQKEPIEFHTFPINDALLENVDPQLVHKLKWFAQDFYTVAEQNGKIRMYNMQCDMQGVRSFGGYKAPTAFYYEIAPQPNEGYELSTGMHPALEK
jgi:inner membrane protein